MNPVLIAAICGFLFRELLAVEARQDRSKPFDALYYLRNNWIAIALNTLGTIGLYLAIPEIMHLQVQHLGAQYPILTGFAIGLLGAWLVRKAQDAIKRKVEKAADE